MRGFSSRLLWFGIGALVFWQTAAWAQTAPLVGDAFIQPGGATNYGALIMVNVGGVAGFQGLVQFDLSMLPPGTTAANISAASLRLFVNKVGAPGSINVSVPIAAWSESTVNGLSGPGVGHSVAGPVGVSVAGSYISIPITSQVQSWLNGEPNNGLILTSATPGTNVTFDSKEGTSTSHPAALEIDLLGQPGPVGAQGPGGSSRSNRPHRTGRRYWTAGSDWGAGFSRTGRSHWPGRGYRPDGSNRRSRFGRACRAHGPNRRCRTHRP